MKGKMECGPGERAETGWLYHASAVTGLRQLQPHCSTHGVPYVYALRSKCAALLFGAPKDDFDVLMDVEGDIPVVYECYPNALERVYAGKTCSLYTVKDSGFMEGKTGWEPEWVCPEPVSVVQEERICDLYSRILEEEQQGGCVLHRFAMEEGYQAFIRSEVQERFRWSGLQQTDLERDPRFVRYGSTLWGL